MTLVSPRQAVADLWSGLGLREDALSRLDLEGSEPVLPSSFAVGTAAQASLAVAALAATEIGHSRNGVLQRVSVGIADAAAESSASFSLDGRKPDVWDLIAGLYPCGEGGSGGWIRLHTNFAHHRDGTLRLLGLPTGPGTPREKVAEALQAWQAEDFEARAAAAGLVVAAVRSTADWQRHPQHAADAARPLIELKRLGDAPPLPWPELPDAARPLSGLRVLDLTRVLAGPVAGRTLAAYGAEVMLVNAPHLPNIAAIADTSRGKRSAHADLRNEEDRARFTTALAQAHVLMQGYRPGSIGNLGFGPAEAAALRPGLVYASLSAYGAGGPWQDRRGFDSLVQTATGLNADEAAAAGTAVPKPLPVQILDMATGFLLAFGIEAALLRQRQEGGSWQVGLSLSRTALWLRSLGRVEVGFDAPPPDVASRFETSASGFGTLAGVRHAARFEKTPAGYARPSVPPGTDPLRWD